MTGEHLRAIHAAEDSLLATASDLRGLADAMATVGQGAARGVLEAAERIERDVGAIAGAVGDGLAHDARTGRELLTTEIRLALAASEG